MTTTPDTAAIAARLERLRPRLAERELALLLVDGPIDVRYLSGYTGSNGLALVAASADGPRRFLTDFRYREQAGEQVPSLYERTIVASGELLDALPELLGEGAGRIGFDDRHMTVAAHRRLRERLAESWELVPAPGLVAGLREVKEAGEIQHIAAACELADRALTRVLEGGLVGRSEQAVALALEQEMRGLGAQALSFPSIVASGAHGALPHADPRAVEIPRDVLVTIDWGAQLDGYCSDCTRTYATGEGISGHAREVYELVMEAQETGMRTLRAGLSGREVDAAARAVIEAAGEGENFGHGLGHGVGLEVHEAPRLSRTASEEPLLDGQVVSVEPGVYLAGELGVRIEDLAVVREGGNEALTKLGKQLTVVG